MGGELSLVKEKRRKNKVQENSDDSSTDESESAENDLNRRNDVDRLTLVNIDEIMDNMFGYLFSKLRKLCGIHIDDIGNTQSSVTTTFTSMNDSSNRNGNYNTLSSDTNQLFDSNLSSVSGTGISAGKGGVRTSFNLKDTGSGSTADSAHKGGHIGQIGGSLASKMIGTIKLGTTRGYLVTAAGIQIEKSLEVLGLGNLGKSSNNTIVDGIEIIGCMLVLEQFALDHYEVVFPTSFNSLHTNTTTSLFKSKNDMITNLSSKVEISRQESNSYIIHMLSTLHQEMLSKLQVL